MNFELKRIIVHTFRKVLKLMPARSLGPSKVQGRQGKRVYPYVSYALLAGGTN